jgi:hypothetical protein
MRQAKLRPTVRMISVLVNASSSAPACAKLTLGLRHAQALIHQVFASSTISGTLCSKN